MDQQWEQLRQRCLACRACSLAQERTQVVFGVGDPAAEAPRPDDRRLTFVCVNGEGGQQIPPDYVP